jgi:hypothetical protein
MHPGFAGVLASTRGNSLAWRMIPRCQQDAGSGYAVHPAIRKFYPAMSEFPGQTTRLFNWLGPLSLTAAVVTISPLANGSRADD